MEKYQKDLIKSALQYGALKFGSFKLKSGRTSPYFFNAGMFYHGSSLSKLADCYASKIIDLDIDFDMLFGPAYKGIGLVNITSLALSRNHNFDIPFAYNRKETKDHGEGGLSVGSPISGKVLIIDDVITAGTAIKESVKLIKSCGAEPVGVLVALDREEIANDKNTSAVKEVEKELNLKVRSIITLTDLIQHVESNIELERFTSKIIDYKEKYGINN